MQFSVRAFAISGGVLWGLSIAYMVMLAVLSNHTLPFEFIRQLYFGWISQSWSGVGVGIVLGFVDGAICGALFALIYNLIARATARPE